MAQWALVLAICGCIPPALLASVVLSIVVLALSRDGRERGQSLAIAALVVAGGWILALVALVVLFGGDDQSKDPDPLQEHRGTLSVDELRVYDCFNAGPIGSQTVELSELEIVGCETPHELEVYARAQLPGSEYPGDASAKRQALAACIEEFEGFVKIPAKDSQLTMVYSYAKPEGWAQGDHFAMCAVGEADRKVTGTLRHAAR